MQDTNGSVAGNPQEAHTEGRNSEDTADTFKGLVNDFESIITELDDAASDEGIKGAFTEFYVEHKAAVEKAEEHGRDMSGNVQSGAGRTADTDEYMAPEFQDILDAPLGSIFHGGGTPGPESIPMTTGGFLDPLLTERLNDLSGS